ncbi:hypothetical protein ABB37_07024 [Leptomonas pyrrhocoris]|uniref:Uncharacterized protein n=1 Tax=Leptomonas pyrrhocoris TaxID=157538 RepID=A0A0N0DTM4_LEPPY|nr:hypothetical protein ABB37_07024 [Leptomonas pyrrhocoris]KPA77691.1 hypothetical protein ABB37_07024 [Leptomonas pyrrhocoris]|eukprot:XP_015656130.1 hypothetical protein ABB37_07024 [Leptomonas pyrrhocoris]
MPMAAANVSLTPTSASGLFCNSSPLASAIAVATTEADVHALANVVRGQHSPQPGSSWATDMYGAPQPTAVAVAALHPKRTSLSSTSTSTPAAAAAAAATAVDDDTLLPSPSPSPTASEEQHQAQQPPPPNVSVVEVDDDGTATAPPTAAADVSPGQPPAHSSASGASRLRKNVSWQCGLCGYHVLAMDQDGTPLPFAKSAFDNVLPLMCPRCKLSHTSWQPSTPFNEQGDHLNLPTTYSNRYVAPRGPSAGAARTPLATDSAVAKEDAAATGDGNDGVRLLLRSASPSTYAGVGAVGNTLLSQRAAAASLTVVAQRRAAQLRLHSGATSVQRRAYYCGHCNRRLLRVDANGELVDMDRDEDGSIRPIRCPGCGELHSDWVVKPYAVRR